MSISSDAVITMLELTNASDRIVIWSPCLCRREDNRRTDFFPQHTLSNVVVQSRLGAALKHCPRPISFSACLPLPWRFSLIHDHTTTTTIHTFSTRAKKQICVFPRQTPYAYPSLA